MKRLISCMVNTCIIHYSGQGRVVRFHDQLFSGSGDRVVLQADRVPSFVVPSCQPSSTAVTDKTVSFVMHCTSLAKT